MMGSIERTRRLLRRLLFPSNASPLAVYRRRTPGAVKQTQPLWVPISKAQVYKWGGF